MSEICLECKSKQIISDWASGDIICKNCGLVQAERIISLEAECLYNNKSEHTSRDVYSKQRTSISDPLMANNLSTFLTPAAQQTSHSPSLSVINKLKRYGVSSINRDDACLYKGFAQIKLICDILAMTKECSEYAKEIFKEIIEKRDSFKGKSVCAFGAAALLYAAKISANPLRINGILLSFSPL
jgi:transcription initiation factor TFIIB